MIPSTKFPVAWKLYCYAAILLCFIVVAKGTEIAEGTAVNVSSSSVSPSQLTTSITSNVIVSATNEDLVSALTKEISLITEYQRNHLDSENEDSPNLLRESRNLPQPQGADRGPGSLQATRVFDQAVKNAITSTSYYSTQYRGGAAETQKLSVATQNIVRTAVVGSSPDTRFGSVVTSNSDYYVQNIGGNLITYSYYTKTGGNGEPTYGAATISPTAVTSSQASSTLTAEERCVNCANVGVAPEINPVVRNAVNQILGSGQRVVLDRGTAVTYSTYISARGPFTTVGKVSIREPNTIHVGIKPVRVLQPGAGPVIARDFDSYVQKQGIRDLTISRYVNNNRGTQTVGFVSRQEPIIQPLPPQQIPIQDPVLGPVIHHDFDSYIQLQRGVSVTIRRESDIDPSGFTVYRLITDRPPIIEFTPLAISVSNPGLGPVIDSGFDHYVQLVDSTPVTVQRSVITEGNGITRVQMITFRERLTLTEPPRPITVAFPGRGPIVDSGFDHYIQDEDGTLVTYSRYATPQPDGLTAFGIITQRPLQTIPLPPISITIEQPGLGAVLEHSFDHYVQLINGNRVTVERQSEIGFGGETTYRFITQQNPIVVTLPPTRIEIANRQLGPVMLHDFNEYVQLIDGTRVTFSRYSSTGINGVVTYGKVTERERITRTIPPGFGAIAGGLDIAPPPITAIPGGVDDFARINLGLAKTYKYTNDAYGNQRVGAVTKFGVDNAALGLTSTVVTEPFVTLYKGSPVEGLRTKVHYYYINDVHRKPVYVTNIVGSNNYVPARISRPNVRQVDSVESQVICKHCQGQSGTFTYGRGVTPGERISSFANYKLRGGATARSIDDGLSRILALHKRQNNPAYFSIKPTIVNQAIVQIPGRSHTSLFTTFINGVAVTGTRTVHTPGKTQYTATVGGNSANLNLKNNIENIIRRENLKFQIGRPVDHVVRIPNVSYTSKFTTFKNGAPIVGTRTVYQGDAAHNLNSIQIVSVPFQNVRQVVRKVSSNTGISQQQLINVAPSGPVPSGIKIERVTTVGEDDQVTIKTATIMRGLASSGASVNPPTAVTETMTVQPKRTPGLKANPILTSTAFNENFATTIDGRQIIGKRTKTLFYVKPGQLRSSDTLKARNAQKFQQLYPTV